MLLNINRVQSINTQTLIHKEHNIMQHLNSYINERHSRLPQQQTWTVREPPRLTHKSNHHIKLNTKLQVDLNTSEPTRKVPVKAITSIHLTSKRGKTQFQQFLTNHISPFKVQTYRAISGDISAVIQAGIPVIHSYHTIARPTGHCIVTTVSLSTKHSQHSHSTSTCNSYDWKSYLISMYNKNTIYYIAQYTI